MSYEVQWKKGGAWERVPESLNSGKNEIHHHLLPREEELPAEYPKIRFKKSSNSKESDEIEKPLKTKSRYLGGGIENVKNHIEVNDALRYQFEFDSQTQEISVKELKLLEAFSIRNKTKEGVFFQYTWNEDNEWTEQYLEPDSIWHYGATSEMVSTGYPIIRFNENPEKRYPPEGSEETPLETYTGYFDKDTEIKTNLNDLKEVPYILYQLDFNSETQKVFLDKLERTQKFSIQNTSESHILFQYKWQEGDKWKIDYILSNQVNSYSRRPEKVSEDYPKIRFSVNDNIIPLESSESAEESLKTQIGYFGKDGKIEDDFIHGESREYHFKFDPETQKYSFHEGFLATRESTNQSFWDRLSLTLLFFPLLVAVLIIGVVIIANDFFPKRHIFSIQNDTESTVSYHVKWTKKDDWEEHSLESDELYNQWWTGFFKKRPQIRFDQIINGEKETKELRLETKVRRFRRNNTSKIDREHAHKYHFDFDPETNVLVLYDSEKK